jgi:hypothetical protein
VFTNSTILEYYAEARIADANRQGHDAQRVSEWRQRLPRVLASHLHIVRTHNQSAAPTSPVTPAA